MNLVITMSPADRKRIEAARAKVAQKKAMGKQDGSAPVKVAVKQTATVAATNGQAKSNGNGHDWMAIEILFRAGMLSIREIGRQQNISEGMIRKRAKKGGWHRDLAGKIRKQVREKLVRSTVRTPHASDAEIIEQAASIGSQVIQTHRKDIGALRAMAAGLSAELWVMEPGTEQPEDAATVDPLSLKERSEIFRNLVQAVARVIPLERQAHNLNDEGAELPYEERLRRATELGGASAIIRKE